MSTRSKFLTVFFWLLLLERKLDSRLNSMQEQIDGTAKMLGAMAGE